MNIVPELNLNKHPKDCKNFSLVGAENVRLSNDGSCLQSEEAILRNDEIYEMLRNVIGDSYIIGTIACNNELLLFVESHDDKYIIRYSEELDTAIRYYIYGHNFPRSNVRGTFTYNVNGDLIISFCFQDDSCPLSTLNLGRFDNNGHIDYTRSDFNYVRDTYFEIKDEKLIANVPEVKLPQFGNVAWMNGSTPKGWYYTFIRYKINDLDYTQWYSVGYPLLITSLEKQNIIRYVNRVIPQDKYDNASVTLIGSGCCDSFSSEKEYSDRTLRISIEGIDKHYARYQFGFICVNKGNIKAFITSDLNYNTFVINSENLNPYNNEDLIATYNNYYNVKNIVNYRNRIYISNYKEQQSFNNEVLQNIANGVIVRPIISDNAVRDYKNYIDSNDSLDSDSIENNKNVILIDNNHIPEIYYKTQQGDYLKTTYETVKEEYIYWISYSSLSTPRYVKDGNDTYYQLLYKYRHQNIVFYIDIGNKSYEIVFETLDSGRCKFISTTFTDPTIISDVPPRKDRIYIDTNNSFEDRALNTTLIPGEIYNFYIHFVDKYGQVSQGYKINTHLDFEDISTNVTFLNGYSISYTKTVPISISTIVEGEKCILVNPDDDVFNGDELNVLSLDNGSKVFLADDGLPSEDGEFYVREIVGGSIIPENRFTSLKGLDLKWYQVIDRLGSITEFIPFVNSNGERLHKVPNYDITFLADGDIYTKNIGLSVYFGDKSFDQKDIESYFISYEKFEPVVKHKGVVVKQDYNDANLHSVELVNYNTKDSLFVNFYSGVLDIEDNVDMTFNAMFVERKNIFNFDNDGEIKITDANTHLEHIYPTYYYNLMTPENGGIPVDKCYKIEEKRLQLGGDGNTGRQNIGTSLRIKSGFTLNDDSYTNYKVKLINYTRNLYTSTNKTLIKLSDILPIKEDHDITRGFNGHVSYDGFLMYNANGVKLNAFNYVTDSNGNFYDKIDESSSQATYDKFAIYAQIVDYYDMLNETKSFKNKPQAKSYIVKKFDKDKDTQTAITQSGTFVEPINSIDLFENKIGHDGELDPKTYINNNLSQYYTTEFDKTIRRSEIIADESAENHWRKFPVEGYRSIVENKGKITRLIGIGNTLIAHCEHSMFAFFQDNRLKTNSSDIQLQVPDIFDIDYKEVLSSNLGSCGLQYYHSCIFDDFGYFFFDKDAKRFYHFSGGKIEEIDNSIKNYFDDIRIEDPVFAADKRANRIVIFFQSERAIGEEFCLTYNYGVKSFVSKCNSIRFSEFTCHTKNQLYYVGFSDGDVYNPEYEFKSYKDIHNNWVDAKVYNVYLDERNAVQINCTRENDNSLKSKLSIICNTEYDVLKALEYISYKLFKIDAASRVKELYSGDVLKVCNELLSTGEINIKVSDNEGNVNTLNNYKKPYRELGKWNFNYLREDITNYGDYDSEPSRIYGNHFVIEITFGGKYNLYEFETLDCGIIKYR